MHILRQVGIDFLYLLIFDSSSPLLPPPILLLSHLLQPQNWKKCTYEQNACFLGDSYIKKHLDLVRITVQKLFFKSKSSRVSRIRLLQKSDGWVCGLTECEKAKNS